MTVDYLAGGLGEEGNVIEGARNGKDGLFLALNQTHDVIVTDRMLPSPDGLPILRALRAPNIATPVPRLHSAPNKLKRNSIWPRF